MKLIGNLKQVKRTGWVRRDVPSPESVADHMYRMAMMAFCIPHDSGLDRDKCIKIALVHDMAETMVGDLTPWCNVEKAEKSRREEEATQHISSLVDTEAGKEIYELWLEYEHQKSPEAKFVKDCDKLDMLYQAYEYEEMSGKPGSLQEFFDHTKKTMPELKNEISNVWREDLEQRRQESITHQTDSEETATADVDRHKPESEGQTKDV